MSEGYDDQTVYDIGACLGISSCNRIKLDAYVSSLSLVEQQTFEGPTNEQRGVDVASYLNNLLAHPVSA